MRRVTVLSPHRDDAVFSLAYWLRRWIDSSLNVEVQNFFTVSEYSPWVTSPPGAFRRAIVTAARAYEDKAALRSVAPSIRIRSFHFLDAPLRLGAAVPEVMGVSASGIQMEDRRLVSSKMVKRGIVVAPLALGGHIDHLTVRQAAIASVPAHRLVFYEDLPYAAWTSGAEVRRTAREVEIATGHRLRPVAMRWPGTRRTKMSSALRYSTQIIRADARLISSYAPERGAVERLWVPSYSREVRDLLGRP